MTRPYKFVDCIKGDHPTCPEVGPPGSADVPGFGNEADVCECPCHDEPRGSS